MRILLTSSRLPFALALIRRLAEAGHEVHAADAYAVAPGNHSRYLSGHLITAPPRPETERFVTDVERYVVEHGIERIVPAFEEAFYLATRYDRLQQVTDLFTAPFATLARLHDKATFSDLARKLGLRLPETTVATTPGELRAAIEDYGSYFARAAFSRGGVALLTNTGPLASHTDVDDCRPTPEQPWLVQNFVSGPMQCTYSTLRDGKVLTHLCYRAPRQWEHSTAISFETVDPVPTLAFVEKIGAELAYSGQMSLDFVAADDGLYLIECNPRATDGALLMEAAEASCGLAHDVGETSSAAALQVPAGREVQLDLAVFGQMFTESPADWPKSFSDLLGVRGADRGWHDALPLLYNLLAFGHHARLNLRHRRALLAAMADDIAWDGEQIPGMNESDRELVAAMTRG